jgi:hypothetical protein
MKVYEYRTTADRDAEFAPVAENLCMTHTQTTTGGAVVDTGYMYCLADQGVAVLAWTYDGKPFAMRAEGVNDDVEGLITWFNTLPSLSIQ